MAHPAKAIAVVLDTVMRSVVLKKTLTLARTPAGRYTFSHIINQRSMVSRHDLVANDSFLSNYFK